MARTAVAYSNLVPNGNIADTALTAVATNAGVGNGHVIPTAGPNSKAVPELTVLRVVAGATGGNVTVKAGSNPPALAAGQGDLVVAVANSATQWIGPFESGRFLQSDGSILVDIATGFVAGTITAFRVPRNT
ncbi:MULTISPECIES: hypothetical protein [Streptomyces]|uniref:DUF2190 domain-containing protein n=1 Tax=Streptomyces dengpaensis TaxID=2049881 RepID=A0ABM6ST46_9ACTN|nr:MULTISPECIES: hypothetical protein [Streptomyces]AVH57881.1 hypothetical protein C4B68_21315 [Streptomyces dengpaensis]PIB03936.1 hypothetical protein B1C81_35405 [Streptomyces sp. HG99]